MQCDRCSELLQHCEIASAELSELCVGQLTELLQRDDSQRCLCEHRFHELHARGNLLLEGEREEERELAQRR